MIHGVSPRRCKDDASPRTRTPRVQVLGRAFDSGRLRSFADRVRRATVVDGPRTAAAESRSSRQAKAAPLNAAGPR